MVTLKRWIFWNWYKEGFYGRCRVLFLFLLMLMVYSALLEKDHSKVSETQIKDVEGEDEWEAE